MDLGILGRRAIVCASSRGLGRACAAALAAEGVDVVVNGRDATRLHETATSLREAFPSVRVDAVQGDVTTAEGRDALLAVCPDPDILINNNAGPAPGPFMSNDSGDWVAALEANLLPALLLIRAVLPHMQQRKFGRVVNITSAMVTKPHPVMGLSSGPRAALTAICKGLSIEVAPDNVTINNLLPERFDTDRQIFMARRDAEQQGISFEQAHAAIANTIAAKRLGQPAEFGATCAFVCSAHAGYMTGLNIHLDGGSYPGLV